MTGLSPYLINLPLLHGPARRSYWKNELTALLDGLSGLPDTLESHIAIKAQVEDFLVLRGVEPTGVRLAVDHDTHHATVHLPDTLVAELDRLPVENPHHFAEVY